MINKRAYLPKDWKITKLGNLGEFLKGKGVAKKEILDNGIPCVRYGEIYTIHHEYIKEFHSFINRTSAEGSFKLEKGDLLFAGSGEKLEDIGKCAAFLNDFNAYAGGDIVVLRNHQQNAMFMGFLLNTPIFRRQAHKLGQGHSVVHIYSSGLKNVNIPIPPLPEQQKIAAILSTWDKAIDKLTQLIAAKEQRKKGLMQQLLTGKKRFAGFTDKWKEVKLGKVFQIVGGGTPDTTTSSYWDGDIPWFTPTEIKTKSVKKSRRTISKTGLEKSSAKLLPSGTLLFTTRATIGDVAISEVECSTNQGFQSFLPSKKGSIEFLYYWVQEHRNEFIRRSSGSTFLEISKKEIQKIKIDFPTIQEQQKIASVLSAADNEIELIKTELKSLQKQKKGLMQVLLTGEVRVKII